MRSNQYKYLNCFMEISLWHIEPYVTVTIVQSSSFAQETPYCYLNLPASALIYFTERFHPNGTTQIM